MSRHAHRREAACGCDLGRSAGQPDIGVTDNFFELEDELHHFALQMVSRRAARAPTHRATGRCSAIETIEGARLPSSRDVGPGKERPII